MQFDAATWESEVNAMPPASHDLVVLPFASGERSTGYRGDASFHISGARSTTNPVHVMRATMEAVALRARALWQRLRPFMLADACVVASGGALMTSKCWSRMFSDAMGVSVTVCGENKEASLLGVACQCATHLLKVAAAAGQPSCTQQLQLFISRSFVHGVLPGTPQPAADGDGGSGGGGGGGDEARQLQIEVLQPDAAAHAVYAPLSLAHNPIIRSDVM